MCDTSAAVNSLLHLFLEDISLEDMLGRALDIILLIDWLCLSARGSIFLVDNERKELAMIAQHGLATPIREACARVPFGRCLCGRAALTQEVQFANCVDHRHDVSYDGMIPHGHYCVPIVYQGTTLGVLNLYVRAGHEWRAEEEEFLKAAAAANAGITKRKQAEEQLLLSNEDLRKAIHNVIQIVISTVESRDPYTAGHQRKVADIAAAIATEMGLSEGRIEAVRVAASVHDLGKISVPAEILSKPGRISELEFAVIKTHAEAGHEILKDIEFPWPIAQIVLQHHERMDGSGYPLGLSGDQILLEARIIGAADVLEATASHRPYRAALKLTDGLDELSRERAVKYDPDVVDACLRLYIDNPGELRQAA